MNSKSNINKKNKEDKNLNKKQSEELKETLLSASSKVNKAGNQSS